MVSDDTARRLDVLGCPVVPLSANALLARLERIASVGPFSHVVTLNPEYVMLARRDPAFREAISRAEMVVADGVGVSLATRLLHGVSVERLPGVEIMEALVAMSGRCQAPVYLLGGSAGTVDRVIERLGGHYPDARIAGGESRWTPSENDDAASIAAIRESGARVVLVAYGAPGQVTWIERNRSRLEAAGVRLAVGVGGAFDFHAGRVPRAPRVLRQLGLEWLYRLVRQPWRWRRQLALPAYVWLVLRERWTRH